MTNLTPELSALALAATFTGIMWVPIIVNRLMERGVWPALSDPQPDVRPESNWAYRLGQAHRNAIENLVVFASLILIVHALDLGNELTAMAAGVFLASRVAHALIYTLGIPFFRTLAFAVGFGVQMMLALRIFGLI
jgi:uncharacterized MAPEG superfamily protein